MRHDYDLPPDWDAMSDQERSDWFVQERVRKQAMNQRVPTLEYLTQYIERTERRLEARGYVSLEAMR